MRETKWNAESRKVILRWIGMAYHREIAAARARVSETQLSAWLKRGEIELNTWAEYIDGGGEPDAPDAPQRTEHAIFFEDVQAAEAEAQIALVKPIIESESNEDRKWVAERLYSKQWGKPGKLSIEHSGPGGRPIEMIDARKELFNRLDAAMEREGGDDPVVA